jgi:cytochrome d ubiquinol oxidase subunit I
MPFNLVAFPSQKAQTNYGQVQVPYALSLLVTHSLTGTVPGIDVLEQQAAERIRNGIPAVAALKTLSSDPHNVQALEQFNAHKQDLGYGFLVKRYANDVTTATDAQIAKASRDAIPQVAPMFWSFRIMVLMGLGMLAFFVLALIYTMRNDIENHRWFLRVAVWMIPVPFLACEAGWLVAEVGRQPWTVFGVLPTWMSASTHSVGYMIFSLVGFVALYTIFIVIEMYLMLRAIRNGPDQEHPEKLPRERRATQLPSSYSEA